MVFFRAQIKGAERLGVLGGEPSSSNWQSLVRKRTQEFGLWNARRKPQLAPPENP